MKMDAFTLLVISGMLLTLYIVFLLEFAKSMKESKLGKVNGRCELD